MKNKQLDTKDLLMNKKEELIWRVIDNVINCWYEDGNSRT